MVATVSAGSNAAHQLIGMDIYTGTVLLNENIDPPGANPAFQLQRVSLALTDGRVIVGFGGNSGDCDPYHGLVVSAPEDGSAPSTYTVANLPGDSQGAVWMGGAAPSIDAQGNVWVATGNSAFHSASDTYDQSDSVLKLSPTMQLLDSFAPQLWYNDNAGDADLGSTTPALLPNGLVFEVGKSTTAYVLNQSSLGGVNGQVALRNSFCFADGGSADLNGTLFVPCSNGIEAVTPTASPPTATWTTSSGAHGSPIVAGGLVWSIGGGTLYALNAATGAEVQHFAIGASSSSFPSPSAADGLILAPSSTQIHAFVGPAGLPAPPPPPPPTTSVLIPSNGATVSGSTLLDASASNATSVEFQLFGGVYGFFGPMLCTATPTYYGWLCSWNTTTVPNGSYVVSSVGVQLDWKRLQRGRRQYHGQQPPPRPRACSSLRMGPRCPGRPCWMPLPRTPPASSSSCSAASTASTPRCSARPRRPTTDGCAAGTPRRSPTVPTYCRLRRSTRLAARSVMGGRQYHRQQLRRHLPSLVGPHRWQRLVRLSPWPTTRNWLNEYEICSKASRASRRRRCSGVSPF